MTWLKLGGHRFIFIQLGNSQHQETLFAVARHNDFAILASLESALEAIQAQAGLRSF
jgi:hypothetical protein